MVNLADAVLALYPTAVPGVDWVVTDHGNGPEITYWNEAKLGPEPTPQELAAVTPEQVDATKEAQSTGLVGATTLRYLTQPVSSKLVLPIDVPGLGFWVKGNAKFSFRFSGAYLTDIVTTGIGLAVNGPPAVSLRVLGVIAESLTSARYGAKLAYNDPIRGFGGGGAVPLPFWLEGTLHTGNEGGLFVLRMASEVAGSEATIGAGSTGTLSCIE